MNTAYALQASDMIVTDGSASTMWLHDIARDPNELRLQAMVASGDYFATLAATIEDIASTLPTTDISQYRLQDIVGQLLYLQRNYQVTKRQ